ncbi:hypothetical protein ALP99_100927 [Pseudomonas syringae pv. tomato]|uniref:Uncharacterized protein n=7 Tax=Pseudomonas syringae group TaxID=136849 RepID=A0A0Q0CU66_PSESX|nr:Unknown protein sequence [Pseudomonas syringae pv. maculicola]KPW29620.1 hypothetical protein ALO87_100913 [Pseudomonas syringae pv. apii]KPW44502.1 hypothetical protein ALO88_100955 [Pseudomonas syringae pv. antirrhini]KPW49991.1 hypothetical protein ALO86_100735 [Pseudomonas syringae pv. berberidis]KPY12148.1 hypothetical protein ALO54_100840 [Pseudomonas syringae pv. philadelphi]KPY95183.1 hypothetical protein ALO36_101575 [Pseudomonas syringae pv. tomato]KPZ12740.1 hypothetical protein
MGGANEAKELRSSSFMATPSVTPAQALQAAGFGSIGVVGPPCACAIIEQVADNRN